MKLAALLKPLPLLLGLSVGLTPGQARAATSVIYSNDFEAYTNVATSLADFSDADPVGAEWNLVDDVALSPTNNGAGVQVIGWLTNSAGLSNKCLLLQPATEADIYFTNAKSGTRYQFDFWAYVARGPTSDRSFYVLLRAEGADYNGQDYIAYRTDRVVNSSNLLLYDGYRSTPAWVTIGQHATNRWQHHRLVIDTATQLVSVYVDDMVNPITSSGRVARSETAVPTLMRIVNEGNSADDGWFAIDDISLTVDNAPDLSTTFTEGFESYPARASAADDADPLGPWITVETDGVADGGGRPANPAKVQVVDASVVTPHSGTKCLKLEGGQRAGASIAWGATPQSDVQITWWARVPAANTGGDYVYLRMSLYGAEDGNSFAGDTVLLGYGVRSGLGRSTSLLFYTTAWVDSNFDYTPDTWEEYQLTTYNSVGKYTIIKNPSSANPQVIVDRRPMIGTASRWGPAFMVAWSSSNGTNLPPVYLDDIQVKSLAAIPDPMPVPYTVHYDGGRFTNSQMLTLGTAVGAVAVDPRDNSTILFTIDAPTGGGIYKATKVASGNWVASSTPLVAGLSNPSGLTVGADGTLWWVHDFTAALMRLKAPWSSNSPEQVISDFGVTTPGSAFVDDDPFDVCFAPASFNGTLGHSNQLVVMDRGVDGDPNNALLLVDPATTELNQTNYQQYLLGPSTWALGSMDLVGMAALPASGEIVTLCLDGQVTAVNADGLARSFWPDFYSDPHIPIQPAALAVDPNTGRIWIADDLTNEIWSCSPDGTSGQREVSFPLTNPSRPDYQMDFHEPGLAFAPNGSFMVLSDNSTGNGGGRLIILHNETFTMASFAVTQYSRTAQGFQLSWQPAGATAYRVQRAAGLSGPTNFVDVSGDLTGTTFTDTNAPVAGAFYRVVAKP